MQIRYIVLACTLCLLLAAGAVYGQPSPTAQRFGMPAASAPRHATPVEPGSGATQLPPRLYLPLLRNFSITVLFSDNADAETGAISSPGTVFTEGIRRLYVDVRVAGAGGSRFRTEAIFPTGERSIGEEIIVADAVAYDRYYLCVTTDEACGSGELPLPAGVYVVEVYLDGKLLRTEQAVVQ